MCVYTIIVAWLARYHHIGHWSTKGIQPYRKRVHAREKYVVLLQLARDHVSINDNRLTAVLC